MAVGDNLHDFLSQPGLASRLASDVRFQESCGTIAQIAAKHSVAPLVLREEDCSTRQIFDVVRSSESGYAFLQFPSTLLVDKIPEKCCIGDHFGVQLINPKTALASWMDSRLSAVATVGEACKFGERLDSLLVPIHQHVQAVWGVALEYSGFIEALRYLLHSFSSRKLHTAYFHSIDLSDRTNGPTLVQQQMPRIARREDGSAYILAEPQAKRLERNGAPACAVSFADDGLAGKHMAGLPGISTPFAILSWPFTSALLHCEDAGLGAYNLLLSGAAKIWYIIPASNEAAFLQYLKEAIPNGMGLSYIKQLLPQIPLAQMAALGAVRIVQKPGQAVVTCPGLVFHFTLSCGTSEAEATNYYLDSPATTFVDIWRRWCQYARDCTLDLRMLPRPDSRPSQWLQSVCDDRNHVAWTIGEWMELSEEEFVNAPAPDKWGRAEELAQDARLCASGTAHAEKLQLPTAPVPQMRGKGVVTASIGRAENPERIIDSSKKPKPTTGKQPDMKILSVACHKAKKAKPNVKPDEISQVEFDAFMASLKKTLFDSTVPKAEYAEMKQERDELLSRNAALEKRCADAEELLEGFNSSLTSLQATWTAKAKAFTDAQDS